MEFVFYPKHEHRCPHVGHCPHLGGASLGSLVLAANDQSEYLEMLHGQLDAERRSVAALVAENERLQQQVQQLQRELKAERQQRFCKDRPAKDKPEEPSPAPATNGKKRGAPPGHPGWFRPQPTRWDMIVEVPAPRCCPHCGGAVHPHPHLEAYDHIQEDVVDGRRQVVLYRHVAARCKACRNWVKQAYEGELLGSKVGPHARAMAAFLHNEIGVSARKVPRAVEGLTELAFTAAALLGFEIKLARRAKLLVDDIAAKIASTDDAVNADETYWSLGGQRAYYWIHATGPYVHFRFSISRAGKVSRQVLGDDFSGVLVTDCYSGYDAHTARAKQKCLAHLTRTGRDWQKVVPPDSRAWQFFEDIQVWVTRGCRLHRLRNTLTSGELALETSGLRQEQQRLETTDAIDHDKARRLQGRLRRYTGEWLVFLDDPRVPPTNNRAEQLLRQLVILRKLTFGHRSLRGARITARLMTVKETAKQHGHRVLDFFYRLATDPTRRLLEHLYSGP
jgi:transposase